MTWIQERYEQLQAMWQAHAKAIRPGLSFVCNLHGALTSGLRWDAFLRHVDLFANDAQARQWVGGGAPGVGAYALWNQACSAALLRAAVGDRPTFHIVGAWHTGYSLRRLAKEPVELRMMLAQVVARGARPWCNVAGGTIYDRRWMQPVSEYYQWHAEHEPFLRNRGSLADVGLVWSPSSMARSIGAPGPDPVAAFMGWYEALLAARAVSDVVMDDKLGALASRATRCSSCRAASHWTRAPPARSNGSSRRAGGSSSAAGPSRPRPATGAVRRRSPVWRVSGLRPRPTAPVRTATSTCVAPRRAHCSRASATPTTCRAATGSRHRTRWSAPRARLGTSTRCRSSPIWPSWSTRLPTSRCSRGPAAACTSAPISTRCTRATQLGDTGRLLANALRVARAGRTAAVEVDGPGTFDVQAWEQAASRTVHLVNLTNPRLYGGPIEELVTVGPLTIRIRVDATIPVTGVRLLRSGDRAAWDRADDTVTVTVPAITDFEVVALELDSD